MKYYDLGTARKANYLLRMEFLGLETTLYEVHRNQYEIKINNLQKHFDDIATHFEAHIRPVTCQIRVTKDVPTSYSQTITNLTLEEMIQTNEGLFLPVERFNALLVSRFPSIDIYETSAKRNEDLIAIVKVGPKTTDSETNALIKFVLDMKIGFSLVEVIKEKPPNTSPIFVSTPLIACTDKSFAFSVRDSEYWFSNADSIYSNKDGKEELFFVDRSNTKCYLVASSWDSNVNLRSYLLLYDTIYIALPLADRLEQFLERQHISPSEIVEMTEQGRLVVFLPNTESRYSKKLLNEIYCHNNNAIVSKRGINTLLATYFCQLEQKYCSFLEASGFKLHELYPQLRFSNKDLMKLVAEFIAWPIKAKAAGFDSLNVFSPLNLSSFGANQLTELFCKFDPAVEFDKLSFEFAVHSSNIHIASALHATYFPFYSQSENGTYSDELIALLLGNTLNAYEHIPDFEQAQINQYSSLLDKEHLAVKLIDTDNTVHVSKFLDRSKKYSTPHRLMRILTNLASMSDKQRRVAISDYNNIISELSEQRENTLEKLPKYCLTGAGFLPVVGDTFSAFSFFKDALADTKSAKEKKDKRIIRKVTEKELGRNDNPYIEDVYVLDKLCRVAKLKY